MVIEGVSPEIDGGRFPIKRVVGQTVIVEADVFADGHDCLACRLSYRHGDGDGWLHLPMRPMANDRWRGEFAVSEVGRYCYTLEAWVDPFATWQRDLGKRLEAGQDVRVDLLIGGQHIAAAAQRARQSAAARPMPSAWVDWARLVGGPADTEAIEVALSTGLTDLMAQYPDNRFATPYGKELAVVVDREKAAFSAWYELFPRSSSLQPGRHGTLADLEARVPEVAEMGFDVLYLPPIHPIGRTQQQGAQ